MTVHAGYDSIGDHCLGGAQAGTLALQRAMMDRWHTTSDGIYNCRNIRGGTTKSAHAEGRAVDLHWTEEHSGRDIANRLVSLNAELGIQVVIWWDQIWSYRVGRWHYYHGQDPHHSHLHVEQNWSGARDLTYAAAMRVLLPPPPLPKPEPSQEEDDMPWIANPVTDNDSGQYLVNGDKYAPIASQDEAQQLANSGFHTHDVEPLAWALFKSVATEVPR